MDVTLEKQVFSLLSKYHKEKNAAEFQLDSYNEFVSNTLQKIIDDIPEIVIIPKENQTYKVKFGQIYLEKPCIIEEDRSIRPLYPNEARLRDLTYESTLSLDIYDELIDTKDPNENKQGTYTKFVLCKIPTMLKSSLCNLFDKSDEECIKLGECAYDIGGYFVINGKERVLVAQERANYNYVYIFEQKNSNKYKYLAEIRSMSEETGHSTLVETMIVNDGKSVLISLPHIKKAINFVIILKAFGLSENEIVNVVCSKEESENNLKIIVLFCIHECSDITTKDDALRAIGTFSEHVIADDKKSSYAFQILENELFPHLGLSSNKEKVLLLSFMIRKLIISYIHRTLNPQDISYINDRDNLSVKRFESSGMLIADIFRMLLRRTLEKAKKYIVKRPDIITYLSRDSSISLGMRRCFSTGEWGIQKNTYSRSGVSQVLNRLSFSAMVSHLRRVVIPIGKEGKNVKVRQLHPTQIFFFCACESPEGHSIGIVKNFTIMTRITNNIPTCIVRDIIEREKTITLMNDLSYNDWVKYTKIMVGGTFVGITKNAKKTLQNLRAMRKRQELPIDCSITHILLDDVIEIYSDGGRLVRPLFPVKNRKLLFNWEEVSNLSWSEMIEKGYVVYRDSNEIEYSLICMNLTELRENDYEYCEIHPSLMFGVIGSTIPFPEHSQAPRNCYMCLSRGTKVLLSNNSEKNIEDIRVGDFIVSTNTDKMFPEITSVTRVSKQRKKIIKIITPDRREIRCTRDHKFLTSGGDWVNAEDLLDKSIYTLPNYIIEPVSSIIELDEEEDVYDITTNSPYHNFVANGFVVHNCSQAKQSLSTFALSYPLRTDTITHIMHYPQKALIYTQQTRWLGYDDMPQGVNTIVAVMCYTGYNQEDSVIINRGAIDRGLFVCTTFRSFACEEKKKSSAYFESIELPQNDKLRVKKYNYLKLKEDGVIKEGVNVVENDVLVSKNYTHIFKDGEEKKDRSMVVKKGEEGIVDKVFDTTSISGFRLIKIRIRSTRIPEIGDKFAMRNGQKMTCGAILNPEDMPRTESGIIPDMIVNPHCLSGRMTINMILEMGKGKGCALEGKRGDATAFSTSSFDPSEAISEKMREFGCEKYGNEIMYSGFTGERIQAQIFVGPCYYFRLRHLVSDKIHSRNSSGAVQILTLQPSEGRSRLGGIRLGEMERDCLISQGTASTIEERLFKMSDPYQVSVCAKCGVITAEHENCRNCNADKSNIVEINIPYACKLLFQELNAMNIKILILPQTEFLGSNIIARKTKPRGESIFKKEIKKIGNKKIKEMVENANT